MKQLKTQLLTNLTCRQQYKHCQAMPMIVAIHGTSHPDVFKFNGCTSTKRADEAFKSICNHVIQYGSKDKNPRPVWIEPDGTKVPAHTFSINNVGISYDILNGDLPLNTLRRTVWRNSLSEILWIYQKSSNDLVLFDELIGKNTWDVDHQIHNWWNSWAIKDEEGNLILNELGHPTIGSCYGESVRKNNLMKRMLSGIEKDPDSRRHIISLWQNADFEDPHGLKPCVHKSQFVVRHERDGQDYLDASIDIRSWDYITAGAVNQIQYILFAEMVARHTGYKLGNVRFSIANLQIYDRHMEIAENLCKRDSIPMDPRIVFDTEETNFYNISRNDVKMEGYDMKAIDEKNPQVKIPVAI